MSQFIAAVGMLLVLGSCVPGESGQPGQPGAYQDAAWQVRTFHDDQHKVTCWLSYGLYEHGISCLPDAQVTRPEAR